MVQLDAHSVPAPGASAGYRAVVQELTRSWNVFRLYPDDPDRPEFAEAVARLSDAVAALAQDGPCRLELRRGRFVDADGQDLGKAGAGLADALYRHGIEVLHVEADLSRRMLVDVFAAMERGRDALDGLVDTDTGTLTLQRLHPTAVARTEHGDTAGDTAWDALGDPRQQAQRLRDEHGGDPSGEDVLAWFRGVAAALEPERKDDPELIHRMHRIVHCLPHDVREDVRQTMWEHEADQPVAARYIDGMPDAELAQHLAQQPEDAVRDRVHQLVTTGRRGQGFDELVGWWRTTGDADDASQRASVELEEHDADATLARAVADYLRFSGGGGGAAKAIARWKRRVHDALTARDQERLVRVLNPVAAVRDELSPDVRRLLDVAHETALDHGAVVGLLPDDPEAEPTEAQALLRPLGGGAITLLMTALANERRRVHRAQLVGLIASLVPDHLDRLEPWQRDERWFVARNVMTIVERLGDPNAHPLVERALEHEEPRVRLEAARALRALGTDTAVGVLRRLITDHDERVRLGAVEALAASARRSAIDALVAAAEDPETPRDAQERVVEMLGEHPADDALEGLRGLIGSGRLPRRLRNRASLLLSRREGRS